ncbi:MAG: FAD-dependent oxidoreductase [Gemmataceae bacterium]
MNNSTELARNLPATIAERVRIVKDGTPAPQGDFVLYWMHNALRGHENPALDAALKTATELDLPLLVYQGLSERYPFASDRLHTFILQGARDVQTELANRGIAYAFHLERRGHRGPHLKTLANRAALVLTEDMPVEPLVGWVARLVEACKVPVWCVDTACVVPMQLVRKAYDRAFKYREATRKLYDERLTRPWSDQEPNRPPFIPDDLPFEPIDLQTADFARLIAQCEIDHAVGPVPHTLGGSVAGYQRWDQFKDIGLSRYAKKRNDATLLGGVSRMSAYLHFGMVSPFRIAREAAERDAEKYLDELLIWRELAYNFCFYRHKDIDTLRSLPDWAVHTLREHQEDTRPALHSWESLARGKTDDELWNACQHSLLKQGELHNNVRMTWGKAVLQWTENPEQALRTILDLNHRYALDGRDPSSYGGILWCLGQFDRPFQPPQPIIGTVRPRPTEDHARRLNLRAYKEVVYRPLAKDGNRVAVIGAGLSGLFCARTLTDHGYDVKVFDKGRGVSGRMSNRKISDDIQFDHGAQYFTVRDDRFRRYVDSWCDVGIVAEWKGDIVKLQNGGVTDYSSRSRYVGVPGMNAIGKHLAEDCNVNVQTQVAPLERNGDTWLLRDTDGKELGTFDYVVVTTPPVQAVALIGGTSTLTSKIAHVGMQGCWAVMVALQSRLDVPFDGAFVQDSKLSWIARNSSKPGRPDHMDCWVIHGSPEWSDEHIDADHEEVLKVLLDEFWNVTGTQPVPAVHSSAHRWRYSIPPEPLDDVALFDSENQLVLCGDWCCRARVEGAFLSGMAAAGHVLRQLIPGRSPVPSEPQLQQGELFA